MRITKVSSGSVFDIAYKVDALYRTIITVGTNLTSLIRATELEKVIENSQRDINIAFDDELATIFN